MTTTMLLLQQTGWTMSAAAIKLIKQHSTFQGDDTTVDGRQWTTDDGHQTIDNGWWTTDDRGRTMDNNITIKKNMVEFEATTVDAMGRMTTTRGGRG
jgi:hypothetical protein